MAVYFNINDFLQNKPEEDSSSVHLRGDYYSNTVAKTAKETFKNVTAFVDKGDGKTITSSYRLNFVNDNENSLASLVKFIAAAHEEEMKNKGWTRKQPSTGLQNDSTAQDTTR